MEAEESKVLRAQVEVSQIRSEIEKRIQEKEEEFENTRKNHQRAMESMQGNILKVNGGYNMFSFPGSRNSWKGRTLACEEEAGVGYQRS